MTSRQTFIPDDAMGTAEIARQLGLSRWFLAKLKNTPGNDMPPPINDNKKFMLYDRATMQTWIDKRLAAKAQALESKPTMTGLDNAMASAFLRSKPYGG